MSVEVIKVSTDCHEQELLIKAGQILKAGRLVAFPTETVYGLGANALDPQGAHQIYAAKGRPSDNPLIVHIAKLEQLPLIAQTIPDKALALAKVYWPGPLTMVFAKTEVVPLETTGGLDSVAVRMPNHPVALALIDKGGGYIAAPSANVSGRPSPTKAEHVIEDLGERIDMVVDGGDVAMGLESTIVDFSRDRITILRPGYITKAMIEAIIGPIDVDGDEPIKVADEAPKAPGMKYTHYAPKAPLFIVEGEEQAVIDKIQALVGEEIRATGKPGIICTDGSAKAYSQGIVKSLGHRSDEESIARHLYSTLREFDEEEVTCIYSEAFNTPQLGTAIMNRLCKAAGYKIIKI